MTNTLCTKRTTKEGISLGEHFVDYLLSRSVRFIKSKPAASRIRKPMDDAEPVAALNPPPVDSADAAMAAEEPVAEEADLLEEQDSEVADAAAIQLQSVQRGRMARKLSIGDDAAASTAHAPPSGEEVDDDAPAPLEGSDAAAANSFLSRMLGKSPSTQARQQLGNVTSAADAFLGKVGKKVNRNACVDVSALLGEEAAALLSKHSPGAACGFTQRSTGPPLPNCAVHTHFDDALEKKAMVKHSPAASFGTSSRDASHLVVPASGSLSSTLTTEQEKAATGKHVASASFSSQSRNTGKHFLTGAGCDVGSYSGMYSSFSSGRGVGWSAAGQARGSSALLRGNGSSSALAADLHAGEYCRPSHLSAHALILQAPRVLCHRLISPLLTSPHLSLLTHLPSPHLPSPHLPSPHHTRVYP